MHTNLGLVFGGQVTLSIPYTRITNNTTFGVYPQCTVDMALPVLVSRYCNVESTGLGTVFWWSQDHSNYSAMNVP